MMKKMMFRNNSSLRHLTLLISILLFLFSCPAFAEDNRSYRRKISDTISDRITIEAELSIPNLIGILQLELPVQGETEKASVYVIKDSGSIKGNTPTALDDGFNFASWGVTSGKVEVKIINSDCPIYDRELYPSGYEYDPERGFYATYQSGDGISTAEGGEISFYYSGLNDGRVFFVYSLEPLGYKDVQEVVDAGKEDSLYNFWIGAKYILVLSDEEIEYFLANGELQEYGGFNWPGLRDLLTANDSYKNLTAKYEYTPGQFTDVTNQWYSESVRKVYELGLMKGNSDGNFSPEGTITLAEAIAMAARLHNICSGGSGEFTQGTPWYNVYVDYAVKNGIINQDDFSDYSLEAKRGEMAYIFASAIPKTAIVKINNVGTLPDVDDNTKYHDSIFLLYRAGVITGNDAIGTFEPETNITRAQAAAIITRIALPIERKTLDF
jgi:hypothetical protein